MIFSGGTIEDSFTLKQLKQIQPDFVIGVDKGIDFLYRHQIIPDVVVGDFDSADSSAIRFYRARGDVQIREFQPEKDDTDTEIAIRVALEFGVTKLWILGATGTRLDHVMANVRLLKLALDAGAAAYLLDLHNKIYLAKGEVRIQRSELYGKFFSLLAFEDEVTGLQITGAKYPLQNFSLPVASGRCVSNEVSEKEAVITLQSGTLIVFETKD